METAFKNHTKLISASAHKWAKRTGIEFEELQAEGNKIFVEAYLAYNPESGAKFSTYLFSWLENNLHNYCSNNNTSKEVSIFAEAVRECRKESSDGGVFRHDFTDVFGKEDPTFSQLILMDELGRLSKDAKTVADLIFNQRIKNKKDKRHILLEMGWKLPRILRANKELEEFVRGFSI